MPICAIILFSLRQMLHQKVYFDVWLKTSADNGRQFCGDTLLLESFVWKVQRKIAAKLNRDLNTKYKREQTKWSFSDITVGEGGGEGGWYDLNLTPRYLAAS